jgi:hypothetical protein
VGSLIEARCQCGFHAPMALGGGMRSSQLLCAFPARCPKCGKGDVINLIQPPDACRFCNEKVTMLAYDDPAVAGVRHGNTVFSWNVSDEIGRTVRLTDEPYPCFVCGEKQLTFSLVGMWD